MVIWVKLDEFVSTVTKLYMSYSSTLGSKNKGTAPANLNTNDLLVETQDDELDHFLYDTSSTRLDELSDLEKYTGTPRLKHSGGHFDILVWWKDHKREYPILLQIARDVLVVQVSTVASESAFSAGGRVLDPYHSRLDLKMVEALICTKDWVAAARKGVVYTILIPSIFHYIIFTITNTCVYFILLDSKTVTSLVGDLDVLEDFILSLKSKHENNEVFTILRTQLPCRIQFNTAGSN
jgi:hypothetical protein